MAVEHHRAVERVRAAIHSAGHDAEIRWLSDSARTAAAAASALGIEVGQIASSIVFTRPAPDGAGDAVLPVLVITSGRHRVDTALVAAVVGVPALGRADAAFVRMWSGFAIGGVAPVGWKADTALTGHEAEPPALQVVIDEALGEHAEVWAAAGHPHTVFPTTLVALAAMTAGTVARVGD